MLGYVTSDEGRRYDFEDGAYIDTRWDSRKWWAIAQPVDGREAVGFHHVSKARAVEKAREYLGPDHALKEDAK